MNTTYDSAITAIAANQKLINETFIANAAQFGNIRAAYLPASSLIIDTDYQRKPQREINKIAKNFDDDRCGFLEVSYRKDLGVFAIIDGQNRFIAGKMAGRDRFACHILMGISVKEEALRFASQDENKVLVNTYDKFRAEVFAGVPESQKLQMICDEYKIKVKSSHTSQTGYLRSITTAKRTLRVAGEDALRWIFDIIKESHWHNVKSAYSSIMMRALHNIYTSSDTEMLPAIKKNLIALFERTTPEHLIAQAMISYRDGGKHTALTRLLQKMSIPVDTIELIEEK